MLDKELLEQAKKLQSETVRVVEELGILKTLGRFWKPEIVGSATNGLMVLPDVDIHAYTDSPDIRAVVGLLSQFATMPTIQKVQFDNFREHRRDYRKDRINFPHGYYIGLRSIQPSGEWKIDIWFGKRGVFREFDEKELKQLTDEQRIIILRLKEAMKSEKVGYRDGAVSIDFYKAVLHHGVKTLDDFSLYLKTK